MDVFQRIVSFLIPGQAPYGGKPRGSPTPSSSSLHPVDDACDPDEPQCQVLFCGEEGYLFYCSHEEDADYACFSQWYPSEFTDDELFPGVVFKNCEMYMMFNKALLFDDLDSAKAILRCPADDPARVQLLGRRVMNWNRPRWREECDRIVQRGNYLKFTQNTDMQRQLLGTGERFIVEAFAGDRIWSIGFDEPDAPGNEAQWGENKMGRALMAVRARLREEGYPK